jgi:hypothetical protein
VDSLNLPSETRLVQRAIRGESVIIKPNCEMHNTVIFSFQAAGHEYTSSDQPIDDNCQGVSANDRVTVWYLPDNPAINTLRNPIGLIENELVSVALAALIGPAIIMWRVAGALRKSRLKQNA